MNETQCLKAADGHHVVSKSTGKCVNCNEQVYGNFLEFIRSQREDQGEKTGSREGPRS